MEHWYGLPEALFEDRTVQDYPLDYNYLDEQHRFGQAGRLWRQAAPPGSARWNAVIDELVELDFTIVPTLTIYEASRDLMRARRAEWHDEYTLPSLWAFYAPSRKAHGSYWFDWSTEDEVAWKDNYRHLDALPQRLQEPRRPRRAPGRTPASSTSSTGSTTSASWSCCARPASIRWRSSAPRRSRARRRSAARRTSGTVEVGKLADFVVIGREPAREPGRALRHRRHPRERAQRGRARGRRQVHDQGRHRLRRARRCWRTSAGSCARRRRRPGRTSRSPACRLLALRRP